MRNVCAPRLSFSPWTRWEDRREIPGVEYPGVYLLRVGYRRFSGAKAEPRNADYIGMTNSRLGLLGRWAQFDRSVRGLRGHSGGNLIFSQIGHRDQWKKYLYVAAMPIPCNPRDPAPADYIKMGIVAFLEYEAFAEYRKHRPRKKKPTFNTK